VIGKIKKKHIMSTNTSPVVNAASGLLNSDNEKLSMTPSLKISLLLKIVLMTSMIVRNRDIKNSRKYL
jgi:hypothetical protein